MKGAFIPLIVASAAALGAIIFGIARKSSRKNNNVGNTGLVSDNNAKDDYSNRL